MRMRMRKRVIKKGLKCGREREGEDGKGKGKGRRGVCVRAQFDV